MTFNQALTTVRESRENRQAKKHFLACGCYPLHLSIFLKAHLMRRLPDNSVEVLTGLYGDLSGNLTMAAQSDSIAAAVPLEWTDIDPRLGLRSSGGWSSEAENDIIARFDRRLNQLREYIAHLAGRMPVAVARPGLPIPPIGNTVGSQISSFELQIEHHLGCFLAQLAEIPGVRILHRQRIDALVPSNMRLDPKMELVSGSPFTVAYADALASLFSEVLHQQNSKKGLITDLDHTLWSGIVGEAGAEGVSWAQEDHAQVHGLYQQMLGHLADCGVLLGVCSKNNPSPVQAALSRRDLLLSAESLFPVYANWSPKSASVARVLDAWNIGEQDVVFVDDDPMELNEVQQAFPGITCLRFEGQDPSKVWNLLEQLRDLFGKPRLTEEDRLRRASVRVNVEIRESEAHLNSSDFLRDLDGHVTIDYRKSAAGERALELINKTNQFNLNGLRVSEGEWQQYLRQPDTMLAAVAYEDRFGRLGRIAVLVCSPAGTRAKVLHWAMSCRAFSRNIEEHILDSIFRQTSVDEIEFAFLPTARNGPLQACFKRLGAMEVDRGNVRLSRKQFASNCLFLPHQVSEILT
jgi:FkbH-like protein